MKVDLTARGTQALQIFARNPADLVRGLAVELEIELGLRAAGVPIGKGLERAAPERPVRRGGPSDRDIYQRRLPADARLSRKPFGCGDDAPGDQSLAAPGLAGEQENGIAGGNQLAAGDTVFRAGKWKVCTVVSAISALIT